MTLQIGIARADITPPVGIAMVGFAGRDVARDVHDPLYATALVVDDGDTRLVLISLDLLQLMAGTVDAYRARIATITGIPPGRIILACTHNHYGPSVDRDEADVVDSYREHLSHVLAGVAARATDHLQPARIGISWGLSDIGINRRQWRDGVIVLGNNPDGPVDRHVGVARIDTEDGQPLATLVNFACHPVSQGGQMARISADFVGSGRSVLEQLTGAPCLYLQGACGDVNPIRMEDDYEPARTLGVRLGCEATRLWERTLPDQASGVSTLTRSVDLPGYRYHSQERAAHLTAELESDIAERTRQGDDGSGPLWWARQRLERVQTALDSWSSGTALPPIAAQITATRIGPLALVTAPGEIFAENGLLVKEDSPFEHTFFLGYTNGSVGYVPTRSAYPDGGYEVTHACRVDPEAGELISATCGHLLSTISEGHQVG